MTLSVVNNSCCLWSLEVKRYPPSACSTCLSICQWTDSVTFCLHACCCFHILRPFEAHGYVTQGREAWCSEFVILYSFSFFFFKLSSPLSLPFLSFLSLLNRTWHRCPCSWHEHRREGNVLDCRHVCEHYCTYCKFSDLMDILFCRRHSQSVWLGCSFGTNFKMG